jgi:hypothetical protein
MKFFRADLSLRSRVLDPCVKLGRPVLPYWPPDSWWDREYRERIGSNVARRAERVEEPAFLRPQAG